MKPSFPVAGIALELESAGKSVQFLRYPMGTNRAIWQIDWHCPIDTPGKIIPCPWRGQLLNLGPV